MTYNVLDEVKEKVKKVVMCRISFFTNDRIRMGRRPNEAYI